MTGDPKALARAAARQRRAALVALRDPEADAARLAGHVVALVERHARHEPCRVGAYTAYGTEPPTHLLLPALAAAGLEVVLPPMLDDRSLTWLGQGGEELGVDALASARVVVTPGLAVDRSGTRLGQGGGSYDRALAGLARGPGGVLVVTLLHDGELDAAGSLPRDPHDQPVDGVVTADGGLVDLRD